MGELLNRLGKKWLPRAHATTSVAVTEKVLEDLLEHWRNKREQPAASTASVQEIEAWETKYGVRLPGDLRAYVSRVNGILQGEALEFDNNMNTLLPLSAMKPENEWDKNQAPSKRFVIADHCISCFCWTVELDAEYRSVTTVWLSGGTSDNLHRVVAASVFEFLEMYIANAPGMYGRFA